jgi:hypothetical protein
MTQIINEDARKAILGIQVARGQSATNAWENHIQPFFEAKEALLIAAFRSGDIRDLEGLRNLKLQFLALDGLKSEISSYIDTGNLANNMLLEYEVKV